MIHYGYQMMWVAQYVMGSLFSVVTTPVEQITHQLLILSLLYKTI